MRNLIAAALVASILILIIAVSATAQVDTYRESGWATMRYYHQSQGAGRILVDRTPRLTRTHVYVASMGNRTCKARIAMTKGPRTTVWQITNRPNQRTYTELATLARSHGTRDRTVKVHIKTNGNCFVGASVR